MMSMCQIYTRFNIVYVYDVVVIKTPSIKDHAYIYRKFTAELLSYLFFDYTSGVALFYFNECPRTNQGNNLDFHLPILCLTATLKTSSYYISATVVI